MPLLRRPEHSTANTILSTSTCYADLDCVNVIILHAETLGVIMIGRPYLTQSVSLVH